MNRHRKSETPRKCFIAKPVWESIGKGTSTCKQGTLFGRVRSITKHGKDFLFTLK